jgi:hypothetical protein
MRRFWLWRSDSWCGEENPPFPGAEPQPAVPKKWSCDTRSH